MWSTGATAPTFQRRGPMSRLNLFHLVIVKLDTALSLSKGG